MTSAEVELRRLVERWQQLPLDQALSRMPAVRSVVQRLADVVADAEGRPHVEVPDLGPAVVIDQLRVVVYDAQRSTGDDDVDLVFDELTRLRRKLAQTRTSRG